MSWICGVSIDIAVWITRFSEIRRTGPRMRPSGRPNKKTDLSRGWEILSLKSQLRPIIQELLAYNSIQRDIPQSFTSSESVSYNWGGGPLFISTLPDRIRNRLNSSLLYSKATYPEAFA